MDWYSHPIHLKMIHSHKIYRNSYQLYYLTLPRVRRFSHIRRVYLRHFHYNFNRPIFFFHFPHFSKGNVMFARIYTSEFINFTDVEVQCKYFIASGTQKNIQYTRNGTTESECNYIVCSVFNIIGELNTQNLLYLQ